MNKLLNLAVLTVACSALLVGAAFANPPGKTPKGTKQVTSKPVAGKKVAAKKTVKATTSVVSGKKVVGKKSAGKSSMTTRVSRATGVTHKAGPGKITKHHKAKATKKSDVKKTTHPKPARAGTAVAPTKAK